MRKTKNILYVINENLFFFLCIYKRKVLLSILKIKKKIFSGYNVRILEITIGNCYKCDLEIINDPNNNQYFWITRRDLEIETKRSWQVIFDKHKDLSTQKYRKELTPNITFQPNKIL